MEREDILKFKQLLWNNDGTFKEWHYWGFIDKKQFSSIYVGHGVNPELASKQSFQYTGYKDSDGIEIYKDDVITSYEFVEQRGIVRQSNTGKWLIDYGFIVTELFNELIYYKCKVIGNINSNPELLEKVR